MVVRRKTSLPPRFPTAGESVRFGFRFCGSNYFAVAAIDVVGLMVALAVGVVPLSVTEVRPWYITVAIWVGLMVISALTTIVPIRLGLAFWDSQVASQKSGAARREPSRRDAGPFGSALRRLLPWIGFNLLAGVMVVLAVLPFRWILPGAVSNVGWLLVSIVLFCFAFWVVTMLSFVPVIAADGPGDPVTASWRLARAYFGEIVGTIFVLGLMNAAAGLVFLAFGAVIDAEWVSVVVALVYSFAAQAVTIGAFVHMYRMGARRVDLPVTPSRARPTWPP